MTGPDLELRTVQWRGLPLPLWVASRQHLDELLREFALMVAGREQGAPDEDDVPERLIELIERVQRQYGSGTEERDARFFAALDAGERTIDHAMEVPRAAGTAATALGDMLDEVDEYCRQGQHLLTLATPSEVVAFRRWYLSEAVRQLDGAAPTPWREPG